MPPRDGDPLDALIRDSEEVLGELNLTDLGTAGAASAVDTSEYTTAEPVTDGTIELEVTEDRMGVNATFLPASEGGAPLSADIIQRALHGRGIVFGIDANAIAAALSKCNAERVVVSDVRIASGTPARDEVAAAVRLEEALVAPRPVPEPGVRLDFRDRSPYIVVRAGQVLARSLAPRPGRMGKDVTGKAVGFAKASNQQLVPGANTGREGDAIVAACDGHLIVSAQSFWVNQVLQVQGDVDYSTGHVDFPGDVVVQGGITRGFRVTVGGSLFCNRLIDADEVRCGGDLATDQGIVGRGTGRVRVGGTLRAKFIESCHVEAAGPILVANGILNAQVHTLDRLETGLRGLVVGGRLTAANGIAVEQLGSPSGQRTEVCCGIDYSVQARLEWIRDRNQALAARLREVRARQGTAGASRQRLEDLEARLRAAIGQLNEAARKLVLTVDANEAATLEIRGSVYPGCYLEICHVPYPVSREMKRVRFRLDRVTGKILGERF